MNNLPFSLLLILWCVCAGLAVWMVSRLRTLPLEIRKNILSGKIAALQEKKDLLGPEVSEAHQIVAKLGQNKADAALLEERIQKLELEKDQLEPLSKQVAELESKLTQKHNELSEIAAEESGLRDAVIKLQENRNSEEKDLESRRQEVEQLREETDLLRKQKEVLVVDISSEEQNLGELTRRIATGKNEIEQLEKRRDEIVTEHTNTKKDLDIVTEKVSKLKGESQALEKEVTMYSENVGKLREETDSLIKQKDLLTKDITFNVQTLSGLARKIAEGKDEIKQQEKHKDSVIAEYTTVKKELDVATEKHSRLKGEAQALEKEIIERTNHLEALKADYKKAGGADESEDKMADLWAPCFNQTQTVTYGNVSEQDRMKFLENNLKERNMVFAPRTLNAFHTALKVADISPITVLSGISGTGKSLLPRLYSEAMGIHFLGLAVQPRWDSPQDMFGFYNYMEQKYKATELARAMVQFEVFNDLEKGGGLKEQMLMVLLDEMNLARVEYYFSEFLSKLEVRRDIDPEKESDRKNVEIALEMGHGNGKKEVRLYPDRNILFVGTMNEDESTQNLSDKVLDRSCVLRFGKPRKLETSQSVDAVGSGQPSKILLRKTWMNWVDCNGEKPSQKVVDTIGKLNDVMELFGKPFAHRVAQAISSYALNYPHWVRDRENIALADQVEQRILPKLRGLNVDEHQDAFNKLSSILTDLGDVVLSKAFDLGRKSSGSRGMNSFVWRGVDRSEQQ